MKDKNKADARTRREKENTELAALAECLPLPECARNKLDKASIIRLTISYLKLKHFCNEVAGSGWEQAPVAKTLQAQERGIDLLNSLNGFILIVASDGKIIYVSENVATELGFSQIELSSKLIYDYIFNEDHSQMSNVLGYVPEIYKLNSIFHKTDYEVPKSFFLRMRRNSNKKFAGLSHENYKEGLCWKRDLMNSICLELVDAKLRPQCLVSVARTLRKKIKGNYSNMYIYVIFVLSLPVLVHSLCIYIVMVIHFSGYLKMRLKLLPTGYVSTVHENKGLVVIGSTIPSNSVTSVVLYSKSMFMFRAEQDLKLIYSESNVQKFTGYEPQELIHNSLYHYIHPCDAQDLKEAHITLLNKGQVTTKYYRFLQKDGGWVWMQSYMNVVRNVKTSRLKCLLSVNYVLSAVEAKDLLLNAPPPVMDSSDYYQSKPNKPPIAVDDIKVEDDHSMSVNDNNNEYACNSSKENSHSGHSPPTSVCNISEQTLKNNKYFSLDGCSQIPEHNRHSYYLANLSNESSSHYTQPTILSGENEPSLSCQIQHSSYLSSHYLLEKPLQVSLTNSIVTVPQSVSNYHVR